MKNTLKIVAIVLFVGLLSSCSTYQEYIPHVKQGDEIIGQKDLLTDTHKEHLIQVLDYYEVDWKNAKGNIMVSSTIDKELLWNYTTKANDVEWLKTHQPK